MTQFFIVGFHAQPLILIADLATVLAGDHLMVYMVHPTFGAK
jgi:hypothetical protein